MRCTTPRYVRGVRLLWNWVLGSPRGSVEMSPPCLAAVVRPPSWSHLGACSTRAPQVDIVLFVAAFEPEEAQEVKFEGCGFQSMD